MLIGPLNAFPWVLNGLIEAMVSMRRLEEFLALPDFSREEYYTRIYDKEQPEQVPLSLEFKCGTGTISNRCITVPVQYFGYKYH
jgi:hypothetical protein